LVPPLVLGSRCCDHVERITGCWIVLSYWTRVGQRVAAFTDANCACGVLNTGEQELAREPLVGTFANLVRPRLVAGTSQQKRSIISQSSVSGKGEFVGFVAWKRDLANRLRGYFLSIDAVAER
jgi:hypothetical protein